MWELGARVTTASRHLRDLGAVNCRLWNGSGRMPRRGAQAALCGWCAVPKVVTDPWLVMLLWGFLWGWSVKYSPCPADTHPFVTCYHQIPAFSVNRKQLFLSWPALCFKILRNSARRKNRLRALICNNLSARALRKSRWRVLMPHWSL